MQNTIVDMMLRHCNCYARHEMYDKDRDINITTQ